MTSQRSEIFFPRGWGKGFSVTKPDAWLCNAFSLSMIASGEADITVRKISPDTIIGYYLKSAVGHQGAADLFSHLLGVDVEFNRINVQLAHGERLIVGQIKGRLPEGTVLRAEEMPGVDWLIVEVNETPQQKEARLAKCEAHARRVEKSWENRPSAEPTTGWEDEVCPKCGKPINPISVMFGTTSQSSTECQC